MVLAYPYFTGLLLGFRGCEIRILKTIITPEKPRLNLPYFARGRHRLERPQPADVPQAGVRVSAPCAAERRLMLTGLCAWRGLGRPFPCSFYMLQGEMRGGFT